jgi:N utilization substance protein A
LGVRVFRAQQGEELMVTGVAANRLELLQIADAVARDKSIDKDVVLHAMEEAMQRAAKARYGSENDIRVEIDPKTGETHVSRYLAVVELVENDKIEISLTDAHVRNPAAGGFQPHRRPGRETGHRAEGARCRTRTSVQGI